MEFKGTKGEWKLSSSRDNFEFKKATKTELNVIGIDVVGHAGHIMTFGDNEEQKANAQLIASAPELLTTLIKIKECANKEANRFEEMNDYVFNLANSAINKAIKQTL